MNPTFRVLRTAEEWAAAFPLLHEFRPKLTFDVYLSRREELVANRYHLLALLDSERVVSIAGAVVEPHILRGRELRINDLATLSAERSKGYGLRLMEYVNGFASEHGCSQILLYSQLPNTAAHRFYEKAGYTRYGVEFVSELNLQDNKAIDATSSHVTP